MLCLFFPYQYCVIVRVPVSPHLCQYMLLPVFFKSLLYFWLHWIWIDVLGLSLVVASRASSQLQRTGVSLQWLLLLPGLSSWGAQAWLPCDMWYLPALGSEPVYPALASGFLATRPQGKSCTTFSLSIPLLTDTSFCSSLFGSWAIVCWPLVPTHGFLFGLMDSLGLILHCHYIFWCSRLFQFRPVGTPSP